MRGRYRKKREERKKPKKKIWPLVLAGAFILYVLAAVIGTVSIYIKSGDMSVAESFLEFLSNTVVIAIVIVIFSMAVLFLDLIGRLVNFLMGDGFGDPGDGLSGGGGGFSGGGGSFGGGGASR